MARNATFKLDALTVKAVESYPTRFRIVVGDGDSTVTIERKTAMPAKLRKLQAGDVVDLVTQFDEGGG